MKHFLKKEEVIKKTSNRKEYHILTTIERGYGDDCCICPLYDQCIQHKHNKCRPQRIRERNWKSQSKKLKQWKK